MKTIYDCFPCGQEIKDSRVKLYGWFNASGNWSTCKASNTVDSYWVKPNAFVLDQAVLRLEREVDTVQTDHCDWGFRITGDYGIDYRYFTAGGTVNVTISGGAGRIKLDQGSGPAIWNVNNSAQRLEAGVPSVLLKGTNAANALNVNKGDVGVAFFGGETATLLSVNVGYETNPAGDSTVWLGAAVTLANAAIVQTGGNLTTNSATSGTASITQYDGNLKLQIGAQTGLAVLGGTCVYNTTGTLSGTPVVGGSGTLDFSQDLRSKTVTNPINLYGAKSKLLDPNKVVSSLVIDLNQLANSDNLDIGTNIKLTRGTPP
jgi:hypothetical protein